MIAVKTYKTERKYAVCLNLVLIDDLTMWAKCQYI